MATHDLDRRARRGTANDIANLVGVYAQLLPEAQGDLLTNAVDALAAQRVRGLTASDGRAVDSEDWLGDLADDTYPTDDDAARLIGLATDVDLDARSIIFADGSLAIVMSTSSDEMASSEAIYMGYEHVRSVADAGWTLPDPAAFLGIHVAKADFERWQDDGWVLDAEALEAEVRRRCIAEFAAMVALWRGNFFAALLSDGVACGGRFEGAKPRVGRQAPAEIRAMP